MQKKELVFIPVPAIGHLVSTAEFAKRLLDRDERFSITVLVIRTVVSNVDSYVQSLAASDTRIRYINLPDVDSPPLEHMKSPEKFITLLLESYKPHVKEAVLEHVLSKSRPLAGIFIDFFCTSMIDVANELGVDSYLFFTSSAAFLGFLMFVPVHRKTAGKVFQISDPPVNIPTFEHPVPCNVLPTGALSSDGGYDTFSQHGSRFKETKGIIVNTFAELEPYAIRALASDKDAPPVYPVGPILDLKNGKNKGSNTERDNILKWLDDQPNSSVIFLCFGSMGGFQQPQLAQIATALERSGHRFLWSARRLKAKILEAPNGLTNNPDDFLPEGFLKRTKNRGMVCGWAPQVEVLAHKAVGGFVSHCGWNSILESIWYGVPIVTWPIYAEQQPNAFEMVKELGLAVELKMDSRMEIDDVVGADEIEKAIRSVMDEENPVRRRVAEMSKKSREALKEGGSSHASLGCFIDKIIGSNLRNSNGYIK